MINRVSVFCSFLSDFMFNVSRLRCLAHNLPLSVSFMYIHIRGFLEALAGRPFALVLLQCALTSQPRLLKISWKRPHVHKHVAEFSLCFVCLFRLSVPASEHFKRGPPDDSQACLGTADVPQSRVDCETIDACAALLAAKTTGTKKTEQHISAVCFTGRAREWPRGEREEKRKKSREKPGGLRLNRTDETESRRRCSAISTSAVPPL